MCSSNPMAVETDCSNHSNSHVHESEDEVPLVRVHEGRAFKPQTVTVMQTIFSSNDQSITGLVNSTK